MRGQDSELTFRNRSAIALFARLSWQSYRPLGTACGSGVRATVSGTIVSRQSCTEAPQAHEDRQRSPVRSHDRTAPRWPDTFRPQRDRSCRQTMCRRASFDAVANAEFSAHSACWWLSLLRWCVRCRRRAVLRSSRHNWRAGQTTQVATRVNRDEGSACHSLISQETGPIRLIAAGIHRVTGSNPVATRDAKPLFRKELTCSWRAGSPGPDCACWFVLSTPASRSGRVIPGQEPRAVRQSRTLVSSVPDAGFAHGC